MVTRIALVLLCVLCASEEDLAASADRGFAIVDTNVVDVIQGTIRAHQTVLVQSGRITAVAGVDQVSVPSDVRQIVGKGQYVMPGLWDMHVHLRSGQLRTEGLPGVRGGLKPLVDQNAALLDLFLPNGVVGIREMGGDLSEYVHKWRDELAGRRRIGPRILTAMRKIDQEPPEWPGSLGVTTPEEAREAVRQLKQSGADFVKVYFSETTPEVLRAVCEQAHELNLKIVGHWPANISLSSITDLGQDGVEHSFNLFVYRQEDFAQMEREFAVRRKTAALEPDFLETRSRLLSMRDPGAERRTYEAMAAKHVWVTPTIAVGRRAYVDIASHDFTADPRKRYVAAAVWDSWDAHKGGRQAPPEGPARDLLKLLLDESDKATLAAYRAGVPMLAGTDSGVRNSYMFPGFSIHEELESLVGTGLKPADVLRMATINAARWRGEAESEGSVEKGKIADLLLLRSNPLTTIRHTQEIEGVAHAGHFYSRVDLDRMLERVAETAAATNGGVQ